MFGRYGSTLFIFGLLCSPVAWGDGLSKESQNRIEQQFRSSGKSQDAIRLMVAQAGIPACADRVEKESYVPLGLGKIGPQASTKTKKRKSQAEVEIRNGQIKVVRTCPYANLLEKGTVMVLQDFDVKDDRIEMLLREVDPVAGGPEGFDLFSRVEVKLYFDESLLDSDDSAAALESIEHWFRLAESF